MEFEQIAVVADKDFCVQVPFKEMGSTWPRDIVEAKGVLRSSITEHGFIKIHNKAELRFNYDVFPGKEFELIHYFDGDNFLGYRRPGSLSHFGVHVPKINEFRSYMALKGFELIQEVITVKHSNVPDHKHYHYAIYHHPEMLFYWKHIERIGDLNHWKESKDLLEERYSHDIF